MSISTDKKTETFYKERQNQLWSTAEKQRLDQYMKYLNKFNSEGKNWRKWGCYLSERQWGTVRENYNKVDKSWGGCDPKQDRDTFPRDQAIHRAYRWGEDGIAGISDDHQYLCFALALWNGSDPCIKERLYGLTNQEGNHGEDVKEYYFYLDNTPTHSYMRYLYKYPYCYPYDDLLKTNQNRKNDHTPFEYELVDTNVFADNRYFDVLIEYAKNDVEDILIKITAKNCGNEQKTLHLLPTVWFRKLFKKVEQEKTKKSLSDPKGNGTIEIVQNVNGTDLPKTWLYTKGDMKDTLFTNNETDKKEAFDGGASNNDQTYFKNGINNYILEKYLNKKSEAELSSLNYINPAKQGTKASVHYELDLKPGESKTIYLRLSTIDTTQPFKQFEQLFEKRINEADEFYDAISPYNRKGDAREKELYNIQRQAFAGMLWNKQLYYFVVDEWRNGDDDQHKPSKDHQDAMEDWNHLYCEDILSMPDKWEYPWFAAWDLAFHTVTLSLIDPEFAKHQLLLLVMEWYMHPNGQIPAYEWGFSNTNPPVHAWAALNVYQQKKLIYGEDPNDEEFLERIFDKLNINFTWWVNKVDSDGKNIFGGGFLGLDNIRILDLSKEKEEGFSLDQADGTAWMAMYCLNMMKMANELKKYDLQRKYLQHFIYIAKAFDEKLWDKSKGFFFDWIKNIKKEQPLEVYSLVGLVPLFVIEEIHTNMNEAYNSESFYSLNGTLKWFEKHEPNLIKGNPMTNFEDVLDQNGTGNPSSERFISMVSVKDEDQYKDQLGQILEKVLDSKKFLSEFGIRSLSKDTINYCFDWEIQTSKKDNNCCSEWEKQRPCIEYEAAESNKVKMMGGNSNWRGPIWFPINYLLIESLRKFHNYLGDGYKVAYPNTEMKKTLNEVSDDLSNRLINIFKKGKDGKRPVYGNQELFTRPGWDDYILFYEYFHGENGAGLGASHQTGWTGLVANLIQETGVREKSGVESTHNEDKVLAGAPH
jgi:hypothetical protein